LKNVSQYLIGGRNREKVTKIPRGDLLKQHALNIY